MSRDNTYGYKAKHRKTMNFVLVESCQSSPSFSITIIHELHTFIQILTRLKAPNPAPCPIQQAAQPSLPRLGMRMIRDLDLCLLSCHLMQ
jgi:hypothetical protein